MHDARHEPKAYSYTRFSTAEQMHGDSYRRQTEAARRYAASQGLELDESLCIEDLGVSAFHSANLEPEAGLGRFLEAVRQGLIEPGSVLLVESLDRLSRAAPRKTVRLLDEIVEAGLVVVTLSDGQRYDRERLDSDPLSLMLAVMVAVRANDESAMKARRQSAAWAEKRRKVRAGELQRLTLCAPSWLTPDDAGGWAIVEAKAEVVRRIFSMALGGMGVLRITKQLNSEGAPCLRAGAKYWHPATVRALLKSPTPAGTLVPGRVEYIEGRCRRVLEEPVLGAYPAIVSDADYLAVKALFDGRATGPQGKAASRPMRNVLAGLAKCPNCGSTMTHRLFSRGRPQRLICRLVMSGGDCMSRTVRLDEVADAVLKAGPWIVGGIPAGNPSGPLDDQAEQLSGSITGLEAHLADLDGGPQTHLLATRRAEPEAEVDTPRSQLEALQEQCPPVDGLIRERAHRLAAALRDHQHGQPLEPLNAALKLLFREVVVDYRVNRLVFHWRQGGTTTVPFRNSVVPSVV